MRAEMMRTRNINLLHLFTTFHFCHLKVNDVSQQKNLITMRPEINTSTGPNCREVKVFGFCNFFATPSFS